MPPALSPSICRRAAAKRPAAGVATTLLNGAQARQNNNNSKKGKRKHTAADEHKGANAIKGALAGSHYRTDLTAFALRRYAALVAAQKRAAKK
jgi:hypothetical protein